MEKGEVPNHENICITALLELGITKEDLKIFKTSVMLS